MIKFSNFFFQAKKKEAKKSLGHLRLCPKPRNALKLVRSFAASRPQRFLECSMTCRVAPATLFWVSEKINACFLTVGSFVLGCMRYLLFSGEEKRSKKVVGTLATVSQAPQRFFRKFFAYFFTKKYGAYFFQKSRKEI